MKEMNSPILEEKKALALDFILENLLVAGFGSLGKTDIDTIIFAAIMKFGDHSRLTDLELSKYLKLTQRRIQGFKESVSVKYLQINVNEAINAFIEKLNFAKKDGTYIEVPVNDVAIRNEIEGLMDKNNILLHTQLNNKIFRIRIDDFMELILLMESEETDKNLSILWDDIINKLKKSENKFLENGEKNNSNHDIKVSFKKKLIASSIDIGLAAIDDLLPGGKFAKKSVRILLENFSE